MTNLKKSELEKLYNEYRQKSDEVFAETMPHEFVWGFGEADSSVVLIGEAPGKDEVKQGRPFVGKAGQMLTSFLTDAEIPREELFITNTIKFRLSKQGAKEGTLKNRPATKKEIIFSCEYLKREMEIIKPRIVVTMGNVPLRAALICSGMKECEIGTMHGMPVNKAFGIDDVILYPIYHPASLIYNRALEEVYKNDLFELSKMSKKFFQKN